MYIYNELLVQLATVICYKFFLPYKNSLTNIAE